MSLNFGNNLGQNFNLKQLFYRVRMTKGVIVMVISMQQRILASRFD